MAGSSRSLRSEGSGPAETPLPRKLGIKAGDLVLIDGAPEGFTLDDLPDDVHIQTRPGNQPYAVILCFCPDVARLQSRWPQLHSRTTVAGALWIAWPKRASGVQTDLTDNAVREYVLANGRVDVKVCAVDDTWSGLKSVIRKADR